MEGGYKTGPREMAKLSNREIEELVQLRQRVKILQDKEKCVKEHGTQEVMELMEKMRKSQEEHNRPVESFVREGMEKDQLSTSSSKVKRERS
jgi:hypothetical protein